MFFLVYFYSNFFSASADHDVGLGVLPGGGKSDAYYWVTGHHCVSQSEIAAIFKV